jgi:hypothetical protein
MVVQRIDFGAKFADDLAIDRDFAGDDQLFARPPRGNPRVREEFLQTH